MRTLAAEGWLTIVSWVWRCLIWTGIFLAILYLVGARLTLDGRPDPPHAKTKVTAAATGHHLHHRGRSSRLRTSARCR